MRYRYSYRVDPDGPHGEDADMLMDALAHDLTVDGDVWQAVQRFVHRGTAGDDRAPGMQDLIDRIRTQRQALLDRFDADSMTRDLEVPLQDVGHVEPTTCEIHNEALSADESRNAGVREAVGSDTRDVCDDHVGDQIGHLRDPWEHLFLDWAARTVMQPARESSGQQALSPFMRATDYGQPTELTSMLRDLNHVLDSHRSGRESPDVSSFFQRNRELLSGAESFDQLLDDLLRQQSWADALLNVLPGTVRDALQEIRASRGQDDALYREQTFLRDHLRSINASRAIRQPNSFVGQGRWSSEEVFKVLERMCALDRLDRQVCEAQKHGHAAEIDGDLVENLLGADAGAAVASLQCIFDALERAGYVRLTGDSLELTVRGIRKIGDKALKDIFRNLQWQLWGSHGVAMRGIGGDAGEDTRTYEFGTPFLPDMSGTLKNALLRQGRGTPLHLLPHDFEVFTTEHVTQAATVLLLDMSRSMPARGCFAAAKKVALALDSLIRTQFPRDTLYLVGFSDVARQISPDQLHRLSWEESAYGTNMQHGFRLARRLLARHRSGNKHIILVTDGEPTAHFEGDRVLFSYPPTPRTFQETLKEVKRCSQDGIVINTFMLDRNQHLMDFVTQMSQLNRGRALFATPERLGAYILVDYASAREGQSRIAWRR